MYVSLKDYIVAQYVGYLIIEGKKYSVEELKPVI